MIIDLPKHVHMSETGHSLLRLIQNKGTPTLDLLIREAIQNSLDAADSDDNHRSVDIRIYNGHFDTETLADYFEKINEKLVDWYPETSTFIAIRDSNTVGLTGPIRDTDVRNGKFGNLLKLVYEISKHQENEGSGGSWGLGKTIYFRVGIGLVIYYSRIFNESSRRFESRLAAALVEDETQKRTLLNKTRNIDRGIAWWGQPDPESNEETTIPLTDEDEIEEILSVFGIEPYEDEETGTTVIIPFTDEAKLLQETIPASDQDTLDAPYWTKTSVEEYMKISAQKWYAPRLNNSHYSYGKFLRLYINDRLIKKDDMEPVYLLIQTLYNTREGRVLKFNEKSLYSQEVRLVSTFTDSPVAGYINYCLADRDDMKMTPPNNKPSPYKFIGRESDEGENKPIIAFTRKPGMIVNYEVDGDWTNGIPSMDSEHFIIGLFVPKSETKLLSSNTTLEEYLRGCEKADHMSWMDSVDVSNGGKRTDIVRKIKRNCSKKIKETFLVTKNNPHDVSNIGLGRMLADLFMPPEGFTSWDEGRGGSEGPGGSGGSPAGTGGSDSSSGHRVSSGFSFRILEEPVIDGDIISVHALLSFGKKPGGIIESLIITESGHLDESAWIEKIGTSFPMSIQSICINSIREGKKRGKDRFRGEQIIDRSCSFSGFSFSFSDRKNASSVTVSRDDRTSCAIDCTIVCSITEDNLTGTIFFRALEV